MLNKTKSAVSEYYSYIKNKIKWAKYFIADAPSFCKDLFNLKCNQLTMRNCAMKNHALAYMDTNIRTTEEMYREAKAKGDTKNADQLLYVSGVMKVYVEHLESIKQFYVAKKMMSDEGINKAASRHPSLWKRSEKGWTTNE